MILCYSYPPTMKLKDSTKALIVRIILAICITISIAIMYYVNMVKKDYVVFTNPDGPTMDTGL